MLRLRLRLGQGAGMGFADSHLGHLRSLVGPMPIAVPGAQVVVRDRYGRVLLQQRTDDGTWEVPAGACEPGQSFARTAVVELAEETGLASDEADLIPFACLSEPDVHTLRYPNGDVVLAYAMCFLLDGVDPVMQQPRPDLTEADRVGWFEPDALPAPLRDATVAVLDLLQRYLDAGLFQVR